MKLYKWQEQAQVALHQNNYRGVVCSITGSGKTHFALTIFKKLKKRTLIIVPTRALLDQWTKVLYELGVKEDDLGRYYGEEKNWKPVTVATIHSICDMTDLDKKFSFVIFDELHRYGADTWRKFLLNNNFKYRLGLTATLERQDGNHQLLLDKIGKVVYEYTTEDAVGDGLLNDFSIYSVGLELSAGEKAYVKKLDDDIKDALSSFGNDWDKVMKSIKHGNRHAGKVLSLVNKRKKFYNNSALKTEAAFKEADKQLKQGKKIIVFGEYIQTADTLYKKLKKAGHENLFVYYSGNKQSKFKLNAQDKRDVLSEFRNLDSGVLITVKALDEGLNVKDLDVGIMLGYNKTSRQAIQRMGRILRKVEGKHPEMYIYYYKGTSDYFSAKNFVSNFDGVGNIRWI